MRTPLAWHNLWHQKARTTLATAGVAFAVVLMFLQLGFLEAVKASATVFYDALAFDLCVRSRDYLHFAESRTFPEQRLRQALEVPGVASSVPLRIANSYWWHPARRELRTILCLGVADPAKTFRESSLVDSLQVLPGRPRSLIVDTLTRAEYGPRDGRAFGPSDLGTEIELNGRTREIAGSYTLGAGMASGGAAMVLDSEWREACPTFPTGQASLGLLSAAPDVNLSALVRLVEQHLPDDIEVLERREVLARELRHWVWNTNYGLIFQAGVVLAFFVGTAIVYQVLAADVIRKLPEYATLKAIGYGSGYLAGVVVQQALAYAVLGYGVGLALAAVLYEITSRGARIPVRFTWDNVGLVFVLTVVMCGGSGLASLRKLLQANPVDLYS